MESTVLMEKKIMSVRTTLTAFALLAATPAFAHVTLEQREAPGLKLLPKAKVHE